MLKMIVFGTLLTIALIPTGSFAQESVRVIEPVEIKKEKPPASEYEKLVQTPGGVVISKKFPVGDPSLYMFVRSSYRENTPRLKVFTLHVQNSSLDFVRIPLLIRDLESLARSVKALEGRENEEIFFRFSDDQNGFFYPFRDKNGVLTQNLVIYIGTRQFQSPRSNEILPIYIEGLKQGYSKVQELKRVR